MPRKPTTSPKKPLREWLIAGGDADKAAAQAIDADVAQAFARVKTN
jgi:hypothetical protein